MENAKVKERRKGKNREESQNAENQIYRSGAPEEGEDIVNHDRNDHNFYDRTDHVIEFHKPILSSFRVACKSD